MKWTGWGAKIQRNFLAEIWNSSVFSGRKQVISQEKKKKFSTENDGVFPAAIGNLSGYSGQKQVISKKKVFTENASDYPADIGNSSNFSGREQEISKKKRSFSQKRHEIRCQSTKNTNLSLLISSGHSPRLGEHNFRLGGAQAVSWGGTAQVCPPWRRVFNNYFLIDKINDLCMVHVKQSLKYSNWWAYTQYCFFFRAKFDNILLVVDTSNTPSPN